MSSEKSILTLTNLVKDREFTLPDSLANDRTDKGEPCISTMVNGKKHLVLTGKKVSIPYETYCLLRDINIIRRDMSYEGDFDPLKNENI